MVEQIDLFSASVAEEEPKEEHKSELTPRQWALYRLIKYNSLVEHRKTTQKEICEKINGYEWNEDEKCHDHCTTIWSDIAKINLSYKTDYIIISKDFEYCIGNKDETKAFIDRLWKDLEPRLKRYWAYLNKVRKNGQGRLFDENGNPIENENDIRAFIESYGKERIG